MTSSKRPPPEASAGSDQPGSLCPDGETCEFTRGASSAATSTRYPSAAEWAGQERERDREREEDRDRERERALTPLGGLKPIETDQAGSREANGRSYSDDRPDHTIIFLVAVIIVNR